MSSTTILDIESSVGPENCSCCLNNHPYSTKGLDEEEFCFGCQFRKCETGLEIEATHYLQIGALQNYIDLVEKTIETSIEFQGNERICQDCGNRRLLTIVESLDGRKVHFEESCY